MQTTTGDRTMEPEFLSQSGETMTADERLEWARKRVNEARAKGATFHRLSAHPDIPDLILHEGWITKPDDQGEPRFALCLAQAQLKEVDFIARINPPESV